MFKKGFTLAEVLITLAIIGIVAALTIPSVISNYQQQEFKTGLKKAVSVLNEAIQTNIAQDGETPYENDDLFTYLQRHMNVLKSTDIVQCTWWRTYGGYVNCRQANNKNKVFYTTDGMRFEIPNNTQNGRYGNLRMHETGKTFGTCIAWQGSHMGTYCTSEVIRGASHCGSLGLGNDPHKTGTPPCIIVADVNGDKSPNSATKTKNSYGYSGSLEKAYVDKYEFPSVNDKKISDIFAIMITEDRAIPFGVVAQRAMYSK